MSAAAEFNQQTVEQLSRRLRDPAWLSQLRAAAWTAQESLPWPDASDEIWRRTDRALLDPSQGFSIDGAEELLQSVKVNDEQLRHLTQPLADEHLIVRADGAWVSRQVPPGVTVDDIARSSGPQAAWIRQIIEADGLNPGERKLSNLNTAFHHDAIFLDLPEGFTGQVPIRLIRALSAVPRSAVFPLTVIRVGRGSTVTLIEEDLGLPGGGPAGGPHLINGRVELVIEPEATAQYCRIQRWDATAHEFFLQRATLAEAAQLTMVNINLGALVSKTHVIAKLLGRHSTSRVFGFVFGRGQQHIDFHSLQDHQAPQTMSDLLYKAALKDSGRMIYTGLIRIAKSAKQTDAYQANNNLLLSRQAKAETIPMLEILADDVRCKHGATVGPVDEEQLFYLMTRGLPRELAERLLVMGFVEPIIAQVPFEPLQVRLREELEGSLHA